MSCFWKNGMWTCQKLFHMKQLIQKTNWNTKDFFCTMGNIPFFYLKENISIEGFLKSKWDQYARFKLLHYLFFSLPEYLGSAFSCKSFQFSVLKSSLFYICKCTQNLKKLNPPNIIPWAELNHHFNILPYAFSILKWEKQNLKENTYNSSKWCCITWPGEKRAKVM